MAAESEKDTAGQAEASADQRLRLAREEAGLSVNDVALALKLDRDVILALESADYSGLGAPVFVRGYLRSYARLLVLPEDEIAAALDYDDIEPDEFRTRSMTVELKTGANLIGFVLWVGLAVLILVGFLYLWLDEPEQVAGEGVPEFVTTEPVANEAEPEQVQVTEEIPEAPLILTPVEPDIADEPEPIQGAVIPPAEPVSPLAAEVELTLTFNAECWAEVSVSGRRVIYGLEKAGRTRTVSGNPPIKLFFGNVNAVDMLLDGQPFDVSRRARSGANTARFSLDAEEIKAFRKQN